MQSFEGAVEVAAVVYFYSFETPEPQEPVVLTGNTTVGQHQ